METKATSFGSSLLVPCIQELAKQSLDSIPPKYIQLEHRDQSTISISINDASISQIPVIDLQNLLTQDSELANLDLACKQWGFFQLVNHGVDSSFLEKVKAEIQDFFNLPMEEKQQFWQSPEDMQGFGQAFVVSDDQKLDWGDMFFMITLPYHFRKPNLLPKLPLPLRETLEMYSAKLKSLAMTLLQKMAKALDMRSEEMEAIFAEVLQSMRMNYYPPCPQPEKVIGLTPHSDAVGLTILLQLNEVEGLQIKKQSKWIPVKPLPNAFIINVGDIVEIITNGAYKSIEHRATVNSERERLSIATFHSPGLDCKIGPAPSLITDQSPAMFKTVLREEYTRGVVSRKLDGKSNLQTMRIQADQA